MGEHFLKPVGIGRTRFLGSTCTNLLGPRTDRRPVKGRRGGPLGFGRGPEPAWFCVTTAGRGLPGRGGLRSLAMVDPSLFTSNKNRPNSCRISAKAGLASEKTGNARGVP